MTVYPNSIDTDLELPPAQDGVTEIKADVINDIRDAVLKIEETLGTNPQGSLDDLSSRISVSINADGTVNHDALVAAGLIALPIYDNQIASDANIQESKLLLDYSTATLNTNITSLQSLLATIQSGLSTSVNSFNLHVLGQGFRHDGYQISISLTGAKLSGLSTVTTVGDAINELDGYLLGGISSIVPHLELDLSSGMKHEAANITVDTSDFEFIIDRNATDVQSALNSIDSSSGALGVTHVEDFHSSGIFKEIVSGDAYNSQQKILSANIITYTEGYDGYGIVTFPNLASFSGYDIQPGDILVVGGSVLDTGSYQIRVVGPLNDPDILGRLPALNPNQLSVFHIFQETKIVSDDVVAEIFKSAFVSSDVRPLACVVRNNESIVDTVSVMHPHSAQVKSIGFDGTILAVDGYHLGVRVGVGGGLFRHIDIPDLNLERLTTNAANPVDARSVAERINAYVADTSAGRHFPITAYRIGDELSIAHNWVGPEYTLEILDGYSGNFALGFDGYGADVVNKVIYGNIGYSYSVNGKSLSEINSLFDGYAVLASTSSSLSLYSLDGQIINPLDYGIVQGSVLHVSGHPTTDANGSYTIFVSTTTEVFVFDTDTISSGTFNVSVSSADIALSTLANDLTPSAGLVQAYIDSNENILLHQRLIFGNTLGSAFQIVNVSSGFPLGDTTIYLNTSSLVTNSFSLVADTLTGETVTISKTFVGSFNLYHPNNIDYVVVNILANGVLIGAIDTITVSAQLPEDEAMLLCTAYFNGDVDITNMVDSRLFGNIGTNKVRDDLIETLSQRPVADLRSDGVVRGLDVDYNATFIESMTNMVAVTVLGGVAYVDGVRIATQTQKVVLRSYDSSGILINGQKVIGLNDFGTLEEVDYSLATLLLDGYETAYGRILPLYVITLTSGVIADTTSDIIDVRRFINSIDSKLELIVDGSQSNMIGSFNTLEGALLYAQSYPTTEKLVVRIINAVHPLSAIVVPDGVSILGSVPHGGAQQIVNDNVSNQAFITLSGNNRLENVNIVASSADVDGYLVSISGSNVNIDSCSFQFQSGVAAYTSDIAIYMGPNIENIKISNNIIDLVFSGIASDSIVENLLIDRNKISGVIGTVGDSCGIRLACGDVDGYRMVISNNDIFIPATSSSTNLLGIFVKVISGRTLDTLEITGNRISGDLVNSASNGVRVEGVHDGLISNLIVNNNEISNINYQDIQIYGIYCNNIVNAFISGNILSDIGTGQTENYGIFIDNGPSPTSSLEFAEIKSNAIIDGYMVNGIYVSAQVGDAAIVNISGNNMINVQLLPGISSPQNAFIYGAASYSSICDNVLSGYTTAYGSPGGPVSGIYWGAATCSRCRISNNTVNLTGDARVSCIYLNLGVTNSLLVGNLFSGTYALTVPPGIANITTNTAANNLSTYP